MATSARVLVEVLKVGWLGAEEDDNNCLGSWVVFLVAGLMLDWWWSEPLGVSLLRVGDE